MALLSKDMNHLATPEKLEISRSRDDGVALELENSVHFAAKVVIQYAGMLLRVRQDCVVVAITLYSRFWLGFDGASLLEHDAIDISAASLYLAAKVSSTPCSPRSVINVFSYLQSIGYSQAQADNIDHDQKDAYYVSEGTYLSRRHLLFKNEAILLHHVGFNLQVHAPHSYCISYLQALEALQDPNGTALARRSFELLNTALLSPQNLYLTHQPHQLAVAAIYLGAKQVGMKLPDTQWYTVFDCEREDLGFLVVGLLSTSDFGQHERKSWHGRNIPMTAQALKEIQKSSENPL